MSSLLHIDASIRQGESFSRKLSAFFADQWRANHPDGGYTYRDLAAEPVPHITHNVREWLFDPDPNADHGVSDQEKALTETITAELRDATTVIIGLPMYNYTIPSTFKTWIDRIVTPAHMVTPDSGPGRLAGKQVVIVTARGGSYAPGTPREGWDYQEPYLRAVLTSVGLSDNLSFVHAELTFATVVPQMAALKPIAEKSIASAYDTLKKLAA